MAIAKSEVVFWYEMSEGTGSSIAEANGGAAGSLANSANWTTGGPTGLSNNVVNIPTGINSNYVLSGVSIPSQVAFTWWGWMKCPTATTANIMGGNNIGSRIARIPTDATGKPQAKISILGVGDDFTIASATSAMDATWRWVTFQSDGAGNCELFQDNVSKGTAVDGNALVSSTIVFGNGGDATSGTNFSIAGNIAQWAWINRALTSAERSDIYASGAGITYTNYFSAGTAARLPTLALLGVG